jgi:hypothetical protein
MRRGEYTEHDETESKYWPFVFQFPAGKMMWDYCQFSFLLSNSNPCGHKKKSVIQSGVITL